MKFVNFTKDFNMVEVFDWCVWVLETCAPPLGLTYKELNVWVFCIIEPIVFVLMAIYILTTFKTKRS